MKHLLRITYFGLLMCSTVIQAQVKIGDNPTSIGTSSILELESTDKGLVISKVTNTAAITNPVNGMMVYDLTSKCIKFYENNVWSDCLSSSSAIKNIILAQIGLESDDTNISASTTVNELSILGVSGVVTTYEAAYQTYIDANPNAFSAPATIAEVQAMVTAVNTNVNSVLAQIGTQADDTNIASTTTVAQLTALGVTGIVTANQGAYQVYIDANPNAFSSPATLAEIQAMIITVNLSTNTLLAQIGTQADNSSVASTTTTAQLTQLGVTDVVTTNQAAYQTYIDANPNAFGNPATIAEIQAMVTAVNNNVSGLLTQIGTQADDTNVASTTTLAQLIDLGVTGTVTTNEAAYQAYIDANPNAFSAPATIAEVQAMVTAVNTNVSGLLTQIGTQADDTNVASTTTLAELTALGVTGTVTTNEAAYQAYIDANPNAFSAPATIAEIQAMVTAVNTNVNTVLAQIGTQADNTSVASTTTTAQLNQLGVTGVVTANQTAYQAYIDANPNAFSAPATIAEIQAMVTAVNTNVNSVLAQIGTQADDTGVPSTTTAAQLIALGVTGVVTANEAAYQAYIDANPNAFSTPATIAEIQAMVTAVNTGTISTINCAGATNNGTLAQGVAASGVSSVISYTGGNGGLHNGQTVASTGVTGLTATLVAGSFASGSGSLTYTITGTPSSGGTASFAINIGGKTCSLTRSVTAILACGTSCSGWTTTSALTSDPVVGYLSGTSLTNYNAANGSTLIQITEAEFTAMQNSSGVNVANTRVEYFGSGGYLSGDFTEISRVNPVPPSITWMAFGYHAAYAQNVDFLITDSNTNRIIWQSPTTAVPGGKSFWVFKYNSAPAFPVWANVGVHRYGDAVGAGGSSSGFYYYSVGGTAPCSVGVTTSSCNCPVIPVIGLGRYN